MNQAKRVVAVGLAIVVCGAWCFAAGPENLAVSVHETNVQGSGAPASATAQRSQIASLTDNELQAEQRIESVLDAKLKSPLDFVETPFNTVVSMLVEEYDLPILFDVNALESVAQSPEAEVTINIRNVSLRTALDYITRQLNVAFVVDREVLLITSEDEASSRVQTRVYQIDDLLPKNQAGGKAGFTPIVEVITRCVDRDTWAANKSGDGEICIVEPGVLVVTQTQSVHAEITRLLATIRRVKSTIPAGKTAAPAAPTADRDPFGGF
jgi:hypothetical protein